MNPERRALIRPAPAIAKKSPPKATVSEIRKSIARDSVRLGGVRFSGRLDWGRPATTKSRRPRVETEAACVPILAPLDYDGIGSTHDDGAFLDANGVRETHAADRSGLSTVHLNGLPGDL